MNFSPHHLIDIASILAGLCLLIVVIGKSSKNLRSLILYWVAAIMLLIGGSLGILHGFQNIDWVRHHHYLIFYYGCFLENVALGMGLVLVVLQVSQDFEPHKKPSQS